jgi:hypothetical protein
MAKHDENQNGDIAYKEIEGCPAQMYSNRDKYIPKLINLPNESAILQLRTLEVVRIESEDRP